MHLSRKLLIILLVFSCWTANAMNQEDLDPLSSPTSQQRRKMLEPYIVQSSDLAGSPNFYLPQSPTSPEETLLSDILNVYPEINELLLLNTKNPTVALQTLAETPHHLKSLRMGCIKVPILPEGMENLARLITGSLIYLRLDSVNFSREDIKVIADAFPSSLSLTTLLLHNIKECGHEGAHFIADSLKRKNALTNLKLSYCCIGNQGVSDIFQALSDNSSLRILHLNDGSGQKKDSKPPLIMDGFQKNTTLTHLHLNNTYYLGPQEMTALCRSLHANSSLTYLSLSYCRLQDDSVNLLGDLFMVKGIRELDLSGNHFSGIGTKILFGALMRNNTLETLHWSHAPSNTDFYLFFQVPTLSTLYLEYNNIGDKDADALSKALRSNSTLRELSLRRNKISKYNENAITQEAKRTNPELNIKF